MSKRIYGIDLGTTYSCIAVVDQFGKAEVVNNTEGNATTPSVVYFQGPGAVAVGQTAVEQIAINPDHVVSMIKRQMGDPEYRLEHHGVSYTPQEISAFILKKLVQDAEQQSNDTITDVVITCPAYFGASEREATRQAGVIAGLNVHYIVPEPTAAAIHYGAQQNTAQTILVYDLGGGTFDVTVMRVEKGLVEVITTDGNKELGGKDWDDAIARYLADEFSGATGIPATDLLDDLGAYGQLMLTAEKLKKSLAKLPKISDIVRFGGQHAQVELTRAKFDEMTRDFLEKTISIMESCVERARALGVQRFDLVLLVGGSTFMPQVSDRVRGMGIAEVKFLEPHLAVAKGAALLGHHCQADEIKDAWIGKLWKGDPAKAPASVVEEAKKRAAQEIGLPPGRVVEDLNIRLKASKNLGIGALDMRGGARTLRCLNLILRDSPIPAAVTRTLHTVDAGQVSVALRLYETNFDGDEADFVDLEHCKVLDESTDIEFGRPLPQGTPVGVTFELSEDAMLTASAVEATTGRSASVTVHISGLLNEQEVEVAKRQTKDIAVY